MAAEVIRSCKRHGSRRQSFRRPWLGTYSAPEDADPWSKKAWRAANPALGDFRSLSDVERLAKQAQRMPARENAFRNLILNQRVASEARFIDAAAWRACSGEPDIPVGARVYAGLDPVI